MSLASLQRGASLSSSPSTSATGTHAKPTAARQRHSSSGVTVKDCPNSPPFNPSTLRRTSSISNADARLPRSSNILQLSECCLTGWLLDKSCLQIQPIPFEVHATRFQRAQPQSCLQRKLGRCSTGLTFQTSSG